MSVPVQDAESIEAKNENTSPQLEVSSSRGSATMINVTGGHIGSITMSGLATSFGQNAPAKQTTGATSSKGSETVIAHKKKD